MRKLIFLISAISMLALLACSGQKQDEQMAEKKVAPEEPAVTYSSWNAVCPVQGHEVDTTISTVEYNGKAYGFCCEGCDKKFAENPETYVSNLSEDGKEFIKPDSEG